VKRRKATAFEKLEIATISFQTLPPSSLILKMIWMLHTYTPMYRKNIAWLAVFFCLCPRLGGDEPRQQASDLTQYDALIKPGDRNHWAFQPVRRPAVPSRPDHASPAAANWVRNPIDAFVLTKLQSRGWQPAAAAEPRQLVRRLYLDVIGIPPTIAEQEEFVSQATNSSVDRAVDRLVDELLARPAYGERWARHWLDLVRYAETNGYERDATKPNVWRYRDYIIRSLNDDKPFDRFATEQIAGDELPDSSAETLIATGFHRLGHWDDEPADPAEDRFDQLDDIVSTTSQAFLGLTIGCARCHNHKFEPLTMHDYYRMVAIFNPLERPRNGRTELDLPAGTQPEIDTQNERDAAIESIQKQIADLHSSARTEYLNSGRSNLPADVLLAFWTESAKRSEDQKQLVLKFTKQVDDQVAGRLPHETKQQIELLEQRIRDLRARTPDLIRGYFMREARVSPPATYLLLRGKATRPGPEVAPGVPAVLVAAQPQFVPPLGDTAWRRLTLARWIANVDNPLTARVIVNRVWQHHFGAGIVRTPNDFGKAGAAPTHPELLDWLADWFVHDSAWSLKKLHRLILTSNAYRMSKRWSAEQGDADPANEFLWRQNYRRLEVEAIRDSVLAASGEFNHKMFGPSMLPAVPKEALEGNSDPDKIWKASEDREAARRTIYAFIKRSMVVPMLEVLDLCDSTRSSAERQVTTIAPQALTLFNGEFVNREARKFAERIVSEVGSDPKRQIERAYMLALCREPTESEKNIMLRYYHDASQPIAQRVTADATDAGRTALEQVCRAIFNLNEFAYPD
jgi:hypothetical protein